MTCEQYVALASDDQLTLLAWMDGYGRSKHTIEDVGEGELEREVAAVVTECRETPKLSWWQKFESRLPGGKKRIKPAALTCEQFGELDRSIQPEIVAFARGHAAGARSAEKVVYERDLDAGT